MLAPTPTHSPSASRPWAVATCRLPRAPPRRTTAPVHAEHHPRGGGGQHRARLQPRSMRDAPGAPQHPHPLTHTNHTLGPASQPHTDSAHAPFLATASLHARVHPRGGGGQLRGHLQPRSRRASPGGTPHHCLASDLLLSHSASDSEPSPAGQHMFASFIAASFRAFRPRLVSAYSAWHPGDAAAPKTAAVEDHA